MMNDVVAKALVAAVHGAALAQLRYGPVQSWQSVAAEVDVLIDDVLARLEPSEIEEVCHELGVEQPNRAFVETTVRDKVHGLMTAAFAA